MDAVGVGRRSLGSLASLSEVIEDCDERSTNRCWFVMTEEQVESMIWVLKIRPSESSETESQDGVVA